MQGHKNESYLSRAKKYVIQGGTVGESGPQELAEISGLYARQLGRMLRAKFGIRKKRCTVSH